MNEVTLYNWVQDVDPPACRSSAEIPLTVTSSQPYASLSLFPSLSVSLSRSIEGLVTCCRDLPPPDACLSSPGAGHIQGHLAHKKQPLRLGPPKDPKHGRSVGFEGRAFSYEPGTPVGPPSGRISLLS